MNIFYSPINSPHTLEATVDGDVLTLNGVVFDFSQLAEGDLLPGTAADSEWISHQDIYRLNGVITLTLLSPYWGPGSQAQRFPEPVAGVNGSVPFPLPDPEEEPPAPPEAIEEESDERED